MYKFKYILMQTQYFNFYTLKYPIAWCMGSMMIENTSIIILYLHCNRTLWRVPDSEGTIARHQPGFLTSHDRQKAKKKIWQKNIQQNKSWNDSTRLNHKSPNMVNKPFCFWQCWSTCEANRWDRHRLLSLFWLFWIWISFY